MKRASFTYSILAMIIGLISLIIALVPFHAFLTIWGDSIFGHYTALRLWKEYLLVIALIGLLYMLLFDRVTRQRMLRRKLVWLVVSYLLVQLVWAAVAGLTHGVTHLALAYGLLINCRFLVFFLLVWAIAERSERLEQRWPKLLLWPAAVVGVFCLLQVFVLPPDFLKHFGYSAATIEPTATINHNQAYLRYFSTLRGANPLGAYLLIPVSALVVLLLRYRRGWRLRRTALLVMSLAALLFSFSRSAWIGAVLSVAAAVVIIAGRSIWQRHRRWLIAVTTLFIVVVGAGVIALRGDTSFQNFVLHTQDNSSVKSTSNGDHASALRSGVSDVVKHPLGHGPGSAGPASEYNDGQGRIAEDYFIQIGQETGVIGLTLFLAVNAGLAYVLWRRRRVDLALIMLVSLIGLSFVNLLSHAWADDTLAYVWWGLAGIAVGSAPAARKIGKGSYAIKADQA